MSSKAEQQRRVIVSPEQGELVAPGDAYGPASPEPKWAASVSA